jgi:hypothetical protein
MEANNTTPTKKNESAEATMASPVLVFSSSRWIDFFQTAFHQRCVKKRVFLL